jgi:hypothetical protein
MLQVDPWPGKGLRLSGTLRAVDVEPLVEEIQNHPDGSIALHLEGVSDATTDAAHLLKGWLDALWNGGEGKRIVYLHVVPGNVAHVLQAAGFREREDWHELIYTSPQTGGPIAHRRASETLAEDIAQSLATASSKATPETASAINPDNSVGTTKRAATSL